MLNVRNVAVVESDPSGSKVPISNVDFLCSQRVLQPLGSEIVRSAASAHFVALEKLGLPPLQTAPMSIRLNERDEPVAFIQQVREESSQYILQTDIHSGTVSFFSVLPHAKSIMATVFPVENGENAYVALELGTFAVRRKHRWERNGNHSGFYINGYHTPPETAIASSDLKILSDSRIATTAAGELWSSVGNVVQKLSGVA